MTQWYFKFNGVNDFDDLIQQCLQRIPQYHQVYPAAKPDVSTSIEEMVNKGFPPNQNIVWHRATHSQKRYYWIMKPNGDDEVRVKVSNGGICSKADRDLRILTSTSECRKIVRQFLVRWDNSGVLPGWKTIWTIFNIANYDISERRIKAIHKIIQDHVIREKIDSGNSTDSDLESIDGQISLETHSDTGNQNEKDVLGIDQNPADLNNTQPSHTINTVHQDQTQFVSASAITKTTKSSTSNDEQLITIASTYLNHQHETIDVCSQPTNVGERSEEHSAPKRKRQRRVYEQRQSPYATRQRKQTKTEIKLNKLV